MKLVKRPTIQTPGVSRAARVRAGGAAALVTLLLAGVGYKAYGLQIADGERLREQALRQHVHTVEIPAPRGAILDARGRPLAISADAESVWADPRAVSDVAGTSERLAKALALDVNLVEARLASRKRFAWIARRVTPEQAKAVRAMKMVGVEVAHEPRRWYPERTAGGPVIGFAGLDGNGLDGLELALDDKLTGTKARFAALRDARGKTMMAEGLSEPTPGATVQLTIDRAIQHIADDALAAAVTANKAKAGTAVVIDVKTGGVLAMSSVPTYDPNDPAAAVKAAARNRAVTDAFEIGSVMKVFTVVGALDAGVVKADEVFDVEWGTWRAPGKTVTDVHKEHYLTVGGIIKHSSNVGTAKIGLRLGRARLYDTLMKFGFGSRTGIELPGETSGRVRPGDRWREVELVTISYGYGVMVSPLQAAAALAAVGNGGVYNPPRLIERITAADGAALYQRPDESRQVMKPRTAALLLPMLASVFDTGKERGTAAGVAVPGFRAGGKTGTAYKLDPATKRYSTDKYLSSFAGLVPIDAPRLAIVVIIDEPNGDSHYGGKVAGLAFGQIASASLRYLGVPGDVPLPPEPTVGKPGAGAAVAKPGTSAGAVPASAPDEAEDLVEPPPDAELDVPGAVTVPDFRGLGSARALALAAERGLQIELHGSGRCATQSVPPGPVAAGTTITLELVDRD